MTYESTRDIRPSAPSGSRMNRAFLNSLLSIRERYHPLFHLRRFRAFQRLTRVLDVPVKIRFPSVSHGVYVSLSKNLSWVISGGETAEEREREHFVALVQRCKFQNFLDVGANVGLYGFMFRTIANNGVVTMIEPDEDNANLIRRTITRSGVKDIKLIQGAVSDSSGFLTFYKDDLSGATGSVERGGNDAFVTSHYRYKPSEVTVPSVTLDELFSGEDPDFVKIDVEGAELKVLMGADKTISRSSPALFFECDSQRASVCSFLSERGYIIFDFSSMQVTETLAHNNLALHSVKHSATIESIKSGRFF
jgi:FkbM family methyltransferase